MADLWDTYIGDKTAFIFGRNLKTSNQKNVIIINTPFVYY